MKINCGIGMLHAYVIHVAKEKKNIKMGLVEDHIFQLGAVGGPAASLEVCLKHSMAQIYHG